MKRLPLAPWVLGLLLLAGRPGLAAPAAYSWQMAHARVLETGDLEWSPRPFRRERGASVRYVDYDGGDDSRDGLMSATAWKHHPRGAEARGKAAACGGIHTCVFKRGVAYRGTLLADESGEPGNPIRLTSDPSWGTGEAALYGSVALGEGWTRGALKLNGRDQYAVAANAAMNGPLEYPIVGKRGQQGQRTRMVAEGESFASPRVYRGNFLIEVTFRTEPGHTGGVLAEKMEGSGRCDAGVLKGER